MKGAKILGARCSRRKETPKRLWSTTSPNYKASTITFIASLRHHQIKSRGCLQNSHNHAQFEPKIDVSCELRDHQTKSGFLQVWRADAARIWILRAGSTCCTCLTDRWVRLQPIRSSRGTSCRISTEFYQVLGLARNFWVIIIVRFGQPS